ncbi:unnamed protein product [Bursaphelenchus okinawaensis]|uniref:Uncharacterized protein n=1 Tax=Bursaphelenchus okinawaensis TaxID=465554 RepID=A0A811KDE3_9BILA|nr:unnamed protein product [Bursaphelenchus okinawaensis]CAG9102271.1 unnamed protein product [Bursaphelenchus okinawaensis]
MDHDLLLKDLFHNETNLITTPRGDDYIDMTLLHPELAQITLPDVLNTTAKGKILLQKVETGADLGDRKVLLSMANHLRGPIMKYCERPGFPSRNEQRVYLKHLFDPYPFLTIQMFVSNKKQQSGFLENSIRNARRRDSKHQLRGADGAEFANSGNEAGTSGTEFGTNGDDMESNGSRESRKREFSAFTESEEDSDSQDASTSGPKVCRTDGTNGAERFSNSTLDGTSQMAFKNEKKIEELPTGLVHLLELAEQRLAEEKSNQMLAQKGQNLSTLGLNPTSCDLNSPSYVNYGPNPTSYGQASSVYPSNSSTFGPNTTFSGPISSSYGSNSTSTLQQMLGQAQGQSYYDQSAQLPAQIQAVQPSIPVSNVNMGQNPMFHAQNEPFGLEKGLNNIQDRLSGQEKSLTGLEKDLAILQNQLADQKNEVYAQEQGFSAGNQGFPTQNQEEYGQQSPDKDLYGRLSNFITTMASNMNLQQASPAMSSGNMGIWNGLANSVAQNQGNLMKTGDNMTNDMPVLMAQDPIGTAGYMGQNQAGTAGYAGQNQAGIGGVMGQNLASTSNYMANGATGTSNLMPNGAAGTANFMSSNEAGTTDFMAQNQPILAKLLAQNPENLSQILAENSKNFEIQPASSTANEGSSSEVNSTLDVDEMNPANLLSSLYPCSSNEEDDELNESNERTNVSLRPELLSLNIYDLLDKNEAKLNLEERLRKGEELNRKDYLYMANMIRDPIMKLCERPSYPSRFEQRAFLDHLFKDHANVDLVTFVGNKKQTLGCLENSIRNGRRAKKLRELNKKKPKKEKPPKENNGEPHVPKKRGRKKLLKNIIKEMMEANLPPGEAPPVTPHRSRRPQDPVSVDILNPELLSLNVREMLGSNHKGQVLLAMLDTQEPLPKSEFAKLALQIREPIMRLCEIENRPSRVELRAYFKHLFQDFPNLVLTDFVSNKKQDHGYLERSIRNAKRVINQKNARINALKQQHEEAAATDETIASMSFSDYLKNPMKPGRKPRGNYVKRKKGPIDNTVSIVYNTQSLPYDGTKSPGHDSTLETDGTNGTITGMEGTMAYTDGTIDYSNSTNNMTFNDGTMASIDGIMANINGSMVGSDGTMASIDGIMAGINGSMADDDMAGINRIMASINGTIEATNGTIDGIDSTIAENGQIGQIEPVESTVIGQDSNDEVSSKVPLEGYQLHENLKEMTIQNLLGSTISGRILLHQIEDEAIVLQKQELNEFCKYIRDPIMRFCERELYPRRHEMRAFLLHLFEPYPKMKAYVRELVCDKKQLLGLLEDSIHGIRRRLRTKGILPPPAAVPNLDKSFISQGEQNPVPNEEESQEPESTSNPTDMLLQAALAAIQQQQQE